MRRLLRARKLVILLAMLCLGVATDDVIYIVGRKVVVRLQDPTDGLLPRRGSTRTLVAVARLLHRWLKCQEAVVAAPTLPLNGSPAEKRAARARRHLKRISGVSHHAMGRLISVFELWAEKSIRKGEMVFSVATNSGYAARIVVPPRVRVLPSAPHQKSGVGDLAAAVIIGVAVGQRLSTARGRTASVEKSAAELKFQAGDRVMYDGYVERPWLKLPRRRYANEA